MEQLDDLSLHYGWSVREKQRIDELINRQSRITAIGFLKDVFGEIEVNGIKLSDYHKIDAELLYEIYDANIKSLNK